MRFMSISLALAAALLMVTACNSKSSSSSDQSGSTTAASTEPSASAAAGGAEGASSAPETNGEVPSYPGASTQASGSNSGAMGSAAGTVMTTDDSFDKVYAWYQQHMPAGSEKSHTTSPVESAVFTLGEAGSNQTSVTLTTQAGKTMITIAHVKM